MTGDDTLGVIACETLYAELRQLAPDAEIRYIPQEYHEFPVNVPRSAAIEEMLSDRVRELESAGVDRIHLLYDAEQDVLDGIESGTVPLFHGTAGDCISLFLHGVEPLEQGERKASGTYYLTRGWIDRGVDAHKLYRGFLGEGNALVDRFDRAAADNDDLQVTWPETDAYEHAVDRGSGMSRDSVGRFFHDVVRFYDRVVLVDTGTLLPFHHEYAEAFREFVEELSREHGDGHGVERSLVDGNTAVLGSLVNDDTDPQYLKRISGRHV